MRHHSTDCIYSPLVVQERKWKWEAVETARCWADEDEAEVRRCEEEAKARRVEAEARSMADKAKDYNTCNCTWMDVCTHGTAKTTKPEENTEGMAAYRTTDPFKANFSEFRDTLYLAKVCLEHKISYEILPR